MKKVIEKLNVCLADLNVFYRKLQNYHWNIDGRNFFTIHAKLEEYYDEVNENIDTVAERILSIGGRPYGTMKKYLEITKIKEAADKSITDLEIVEVIKGDFEYLLKEVKEIKVAADEADDYGTSAMVDEMIMDYEKKLWMLGAFMKK